MKSRLFNSWFICLLGVVSFGVSACQSTSEKLEDKTTTTIRVLESTEVDSVVADFPVGFKMLNSGDWQFIGYYNKDRELTVASRKRSERQWNYKVLPTKVGWDSHNRITMALDRDSCIHVSGNMHNDTLIYFKTQRANDISTFEPVFPMVAAQDELGCTYPNFIKNSEHALIYSYRKGGSGNGITISNIYDEQSGAFQRLTDQPLFDGLGMMSAYAKGPILGPDQTFHIIWFWRDTPACETNHDLSYARSRDLVHWETLGGQKIKLPITPEKSVFTVDPVPPGGGVINGGAQLFFDGNKNPLIAYMKYDDAGNSQIFLARPSKGHWVSQQISDWNYRWNFSGPGSITFEIRVGKCGATDDGKIVIPYQHIKRGTGELIIEPKTWSLIEDRPTAIAGNQDYPSDLLAPNSGIDSVSVKWLKSSSLENPNEYYALRWETMGKRRFYKPREKPVKPSVLTLYKLSRE